MKLDFHSRSSAFVLALAGFLAAASAAFGAAETERKYSTEEDWQKSLKQADAKISKAEQALRGSDPIARRQAVLDLQADPIAVQRLNKREGAAAEAIRKGVNAEVSDIRTQAKENIKNDYAEKWNAEHPNQKIKASDVEIVEPTNRKAPSSTSKVSQDWDVTVRVNGQDVAAKSAKAVVDKAYFDATGGKGTFGNATADQVAERQHVETTDKNHLEAYKDAEKLGVMGNEADLKNYKRGQDFADVMDYKGREALKMEGAAGEYEQFRQASKQYDNIVSKTVGAHGGKVPTKVEEGMQVMKDVADMKISPAEGRARLAAMGETAESMTKKAGDIMEAAEKLKPTAAKTKADVPDSKIGKAADAAGKIVDGIGYGSDLDKIAEGYINDDAGQIKEGLKDLAEDVASELPVVGAAITAGKTAEAVSGSVADHAASRVEIENLDAKHGGDEQRAAIYSDLYKARSAAFRDEEGRISPEDQKRLQQECGELASRYVLGDERAKAKVEAAYNKMGKTVPERNSMDRTVGETIVDYAGDVADNAVNMAKGIAQQAEDTAEFVNLAVTGESGRMPKPGETVAEQDQQQRLKEKLKEHGVFDDVAEQLSKAAYGNDPAAAAEANAFINRIAKEVAEERKQAEAKVAAAQSLREAEGGELPPAGGETSVAEGPEGGSLGAFAKDRGNERADATAGDNAFAGLTTRERQQEGWNEQIEIETRRKLEEGAAAAQDIGRKSAADTAAAQEANSWGSAIADGVQQGVTIGLSAAGASFAGTIGEELGHRAVNSVFGDPDHKNLLDDDWRPRGGGESVSSGGGESAAGGGTSVASGGESVSNASTSPAKKACDCKDEAKDSGGSGSVALTAASSGKTAANRGRCVRCGEEKSVNKNGLCLDCVARTVTSEAVKATADGVHKTIEDGVENAKKVLGGTAQNSNPTSGQGVKSSGESVTAASKTASSGKGNGIWAFKGGTCIKCGKKTWVIDGSGDGAGCCQDCYFGASAVHQSVASPFHD